MIVAAFVCFLLLVIAWLAVPGEPKPVAEARGEAQVSELPA